MKMDESSTVLTQFEANSDLVINKCELIDVAEKSPEICLKLPEVKTTSVNVAEHKQQTDLKTVNTNNNLPVSADSDNKPAVINEENERNHSVQQEVLELPEEATSNKYLVEQVEVFSGKEKDDESLTVAVSKLVDLIEEDEVDKIVEENEVEEVLEDEVVEEVTEEVEEVTEDVEEVTEEVHEVTEDVQEVTDDVQEITKDVQEVTENKGMNVDQEIDNEIEELDQEVNKMADVEKDMTEVDQEVTDVDQKVTEADQEVTEVDPEVTEVDTEVTEVDQEVTEVDQEVTDVDQKVTEVDQEMTEVDQEEAEVDKLITEVEQEVTDDVDQEITDVGQKMTDDVDQEVTEVDQEVTDVNQEVTDVDHQRVIDVDQDIADIKEEVADCQEVADVQELVAEVKEEVVDVAEGVQTEETDESLNRMHVMDDVQEGCDETQPSSPGHAEQRVPHDNNEEPPLKLPTITIANIKPLLENGNVTIPEQVVKQSPITNGISSHSYTKDIEEDLQEVVIMKPREREGLPIVQSTKRKGVELLEETVTETKKLKTNLEQFDDFTVRDNVLTNYLDSIDCSTVDRIKSQSELLLREIQKLGDLAIVKEREWNQILHMKKLKEELLLRMQRSKQILLLNNGLEIISDNSQTSMEGAMMHERKMNSRNAAAGRLMRNTGSASPPGSTYEADLRSRNRQVLDVQKVIADYRQSHPETVPRRGRRIRTSLPQESSGGTRYANEGGVLTFSNLALGSGSQVRTNLSIPSDVYSEFSTLLNNMDSERLRSASSASIKELLAQFSKMSPAERQELLQSVVKPAPPPYPEVTVHPVVSLPDITVNNQQSNNGTPTGNNSLLHGILTKTPAKPTDSKSSFSPTLARLLTAPERIYANSRVHSKHQLEQQQQQQQQPVNMSSDHHPNSIGSSNVSLSAILSSSKTRNEITITPVAQFDEKETTSIADEDMEDNSADRLVIDEGGGGDSDVKHKQTAVVVVTNDNVSDSGDEVPQCQGCHQKAAQFVCAGCGNQWYCSRDCQVNAWDEHSELCSG